VIEAFFADRQTLAPNTAVGFTATVSHPDGLAEIVGGTLENADVGTIYGAFQQTAGGTFTVLLTWDQINAATPIDQGRDDVYTFEAVFRDNAGSIARRDIGLGMDCEGLDACDGTCVDWTADGTNCGGCGVTCGVQEACLAGSCNVVSWSPCFLPKDMTCAVACNELGMTCVEDGCGGYTYAYFYSVSDCVANDVGFQTESPCDEYFTGGGSFIDPPDDPPAVRCCCG
jgi:hypothetical protein